MSFTSGTYYIFLIACFFVFWAAADRLKLRVALLVLASAVFYAVTGGRGLLLLTAVAAVDFWTTRLMVRCEKRSMRRLLLALSLACNLGSLCLSRWDFCHT
jgi:D-alanyl-lipoteichoic acid acyltransferase DltB (MBOAT superfamily)